MSCAYLPLATSKRKTLEYTRSPAVKYNDLPSGAPRHRARRVVEAGAHVAAVLGRDVVQLEMRVQDLAPWHAVRDHRVRLPQRRRARACVRLATTPASPAHRRRPRCARRARRRVDDECVAALVAEERRRRRDVGDAPAVGRPTRRATHGELRRVDELGLLLRRDVDDPDVRETEVALVDLRIVAPLTRGVGRLRQRVDAQEGDALAIGRPAEAGDAFLRRS